MAHTLKKVVRIGGGSGGYTLLRGLKAFPLDITAVFTSFDSGGSAGVLRDEFGILPPGDVRRGLLALADEGQAEILRELFQYRFSAKGGSASGGNNGHSALHGHSFGNLFLAALSSIYGGEIEGIRKASELLNIKGKVLPVSLDKSHVHAVLEDGSEIVGETNIDIPKHDGNLRIKNVFLEPIAHIYEETDRAIREADLIVIGPGDLYSSLVPTLCVGGMQEALRASKGKKIAVCNLMTKWGETHGFACSDMIKELLHYSGLEKFDYVICNTQTMSPKLAAAYEEEKKYPMKCDAALNDLAKNVITGDFFSEADIARHDSEKIAKIISEL
ncbi:uridine diphosphate-N-acetylglucosamine-binding protein YvcK [Candidatus Kaiserbacteria bacterium]|nr:uridine diphosphate-N-acetylglucosamine-binding protein YvcK [Candidatus Kaiserbacteria bacterium]